MRIYLGDMEFPAAPERLEVLMEGNWERTELEAVGEVIRYRPPGLRLIRFGGIFPERAYGRPELPKSSHAFPGLRAAGRRHRR